MAEKVIVAMSGGVDSSVAAALLQRQGFDVEGVFMKNWSPETIQSLTDCPWEQDQADAAAVCDKLAIPFRSINFEKEYKERVVNYFLDEYVKNRTPNPDIMCNKEIKFSAFLDAALGAGAHRIATGHYARTWEKEGKYYLGRGLDTTKDQSYFLYALSQQQLARSIFPLGDMQKSVVRELAKEFNLPTAQKKDSQGICFIGHLDVKKFLRDQLPSTQGETMLLPPYQSNISFENRLAAAQKVGAHLGSTFYTIGERAGNIVDNGTYRKLRNNHDVPPIYVLEKRGNTVFVTDNSKDVDFNCTQVTLSNWVGEEIPDNSQEWSGSLVQIRYGQKDKQELRTITSYNKEIIIRTGDSPAMNAVAAGQSLVVYLTNGTVRGGGIIEHCERRTAK